MFVQPTAGSQGGQCERFCLARVRGVPLAGAALGFVALGTAAPKLLRLRIRFFKWIHWTWAASVLEEHFATWVIVGRIVLGGLAVVLFLFGVASAL